MPSDGTAYARRVAAQHSFLTARVSLAPVARIVEVGCSHGHLLGSFAGPHRKLVGFEPTPALRHSAITHLNALNGSSRVHETTWSSKTASVLARNGGIDLFMSSHVLEHVPDLCSFTKELFAAMAPGGAVFTEVPNVTPAWLRAERQQGIMPKSGGGPFHISWVTPMGLLRYFQSAGFQPGTLETFEGYEASTRPNGLWIRAVFYKPLARGSAGVVHGMAVPSR